MNNLVQWIPCWVQKLVTTFFPTSWGRRLNMTRLVMNCLFYTLTRLFYENIGTDIVCPSSNSHGQTELFRLQTMSSYNRNQNHQHKTAVNNNTEAPHPQQLQLVCMRLVHGVIACLFYCFYLLFYLFPISILTVNITQV